MVLEPFGCNVADPLICLPSRFCLLGRLTRRSGKGRIESPGHKEPSIQKATRRTPSKESR
jgi:hypothetical protein